MQGCARLNVDGRHSLYHVMSETKYFDAKTQGDRIAHTNKRHYLS